MKKKEMKKKEFKVGEVFQFGLISLKVIESKNGNACKGCFLEHSELCGQIDCFIGECFHFQREDKTDVIFVKVED